MKNFLFKLAVPAIAIAGVCACSKPAAEEPEISETPQEPAVIQEIALLNVSWAQNVSHTDIFVYGADAAGELESHDKYPGLPSSVPVVSDGKKKTVVAICNCGFGFNLTALKKYDSMQMLSYKFDDENPESPLLSGFCTAGGGNDTISLSPLLCRITLKEISNALDDYVLLENPIIFIDGISASEAVLRTEGFRPKEEVDDTLKAALPYDIGFYSQQPDTEVFCYPNDTPDNIIGPVSTELCFCCEIEGEKCTYRVPLTPFGRGADISVKIDIIDRNEFYYKVK